MTAKEIYGALDQSFTSAQLIAEMESPDVCEKYCWMTPQKARDIRDMAQYRLERGFIKD